MSYFPNAGPSGWTSPAQMMLREEYRYEPSCNIAANTGAMAVAADAFNYEKGQSMADTISGFALMRCYGMSWSSITLYTIVLILIVIVCIILIPFSIPDSVWKNCSICTKSEDYTTYVNGKKRSGTRCLESRKGTVEECKEQGKKKELVISAIVGFVIVAIISSLFKYYLKSRIYTTSALFGEMALRTVF